MATWKLSPQYKKSAVEKMFFHKDGKVISIEQGFRWATFTVESDERPLTDEELKNEDGYELSCIENDECWEMWEMIDGCWLDIQAERDCTPEDVEEFELAWEENSYEGVEELGWYNDDTEYYYHGPLELTNDTTGEVFQGEPDENVSVSGVPHATNTDNPIDFPQQVEEFVNGYANFVENMTDEEWEVLGKEDEPVVTDWYPVETNPVRNGTYQVLETELEVSWPFESNVKAGVWNGKKWDNKNVVKWRGLTSDPETK
jgi:hypothetical protein